MVRQFPHGGKYGGGVYDPEANDDIVGGDDNVVHVPFGENSTQVQLGVAATLGDNGDIDLLDPLDEDDYESKIKKILDTLGLS